MTIEKGQDQDTRQHVSVLPQEVLSYWFSDPSGFYVDGTVGGAGHAERLLQRLNAQGRLLCLDWDPSMLALARGKLRDSRVLWSRANFGELIPCLRKNADGILIDLGFSFDQIRQSQRGLSFEKEGPLDMRLHPAARDTAESLIRRSTVDSLTRLLEDFGGVHRAESVARRILESFRANRLKTTLDMARLCGPRRGRRNPATLVFQALRIAVNREDENINSLLRGAPNVLKEGGRLVIITFHSLEDRMVKNGFRSLEKAGRMKVLTKKPVRASPGEVGSNRRARSASLRVAERI